MKGLILKDLYTLGNYKKTLLVALALMAVFSFAMGNAGGSISAVLVLFTTTLLLSLFSTDEAARWDRTAAALPLGRGAVVAARYLVCLATLGALFLFALLVQLAAGGLRGGPAAEGLAVQGATLCLALVSLAVSLPMAFWLGAEKARMLAIAGYIVPGGLILLAVYLLRQRLEAMSEGALLAIGLGVLAGSLALFAASWPLSRRLYARREF